MRPPAALPVLLDDARHRLAAHPRCPPRPAAPGTALSCPCLCPSCPSIPAAVKQKVGTGHRPWMRTNDGSEGVTFALEPGACFAEHGGSSEPALQQPPVPLMDLGRLHTDVHTCAHTQGTPGADLGHLHTRVHMLRARQELPPLPSAAAPCRVHGRPVITAVSWLMML